METSGSICGRFIHYGYKLACREKVEGVFGDGAVAIERWTGYGQTKIFSVKIGWWDSGHRTNTEKVEEEEIEEKAEMWTFKASWVLTLTVFRGSITS